MTFQVSVTIGPLTFNLRAAVWTCTLRGKQTQHGVLPDQVYQCQWRHHATFQDHSCTRLSSIYCSSPRMPFSKWPDLIAQDRSTCSQSSHHNQLLLHHWDFHSSCTNIPTAGLKPLSSKTIIKIIKMEKETWSLPVFPVLPLPCCLCPSEGPLWKLSQAQGLLEQLINTLVTVVMRSVPSWVGGAKSWGVLVGKYSFRSLGWSYIINERRTEWDNGPKSHLHDLETRGRTDLWPP